MDTITIAAGATVTLDGRVISHAGTFTAEVDKVTEQTVEVDTTYVTFGPTGYTDYAAFHVIVNTGADDALVRFTKGNTPATTARYLFVGVPAGGHAIIPACYYDSSDSVMQGLHSISARALTTNTRLFVMIGRHD